MFFLLPLKSCHWWSTYTHIHNTLLLGSIGYVIYITSLNPHTWMRWVLWLLILYVSLIRSQYPHIWVLHALCHQSGRPRSGHWKRSVLIPIPKKGSTKECPHHQTIALICRATKVMLKILPTRLISLVTQSCPTLWPHGLQHTRLPCPWPTPGAYSNSSIALVMPSNHLTLCCPLLLPLSIFPSIRVFSNESVLCIRWPKDWSFSFSISPSNEYSRTDLI